MSEESSESAELNTDPGDIDPGFGAGLGGFVIAHESPLTHEPAEGAFHYPAARQHFEADGIVGAFDDLDHQLRAESLDPLGERFAGIAAVHPQDAEPSEPAQHQPQRVHQQMPLAAFDPLAGVITNAAAMTIGLDALAIEHGGRGPTALVVGFPDQRAECVIERRPLMVEGPLPKNMIDRLPRWKVGGQIAPWAATLDDIEYGIEDTPTVGGRASAFGGFGEQRLEVSPLGIRETGFIDGVFHAPTEAALKIGRLNPKQMSTYHTTFLSHPSKNLIIQTHS